MKAVKFKNISISNFLSIGNEPVVVAFTPGVHIITGVNKDKDNRRNGVGKTSILDAVYFAIFGKTLREIKKEFISNNINTEPCLVVLEFEVNNTSYKISRGLQPSRLIFTVDGVDSTRDSIANTEKDIHAVLNSSPDFFKFCVLMTLNNSIPFMAQSKIEKKKFIEQIFDLSIFSVMSSKIKDEHSNTRMLLDVENSKLVELTSILNRTLQQKTNKNTEDEKRATEIESKKIETRSAIDKLTKEKSSIVFDDRDFDADIVKSEKRLSELREQHDVIKDKVLDLTSTIKAKKMSCSSISVDGDKCPRCLQSLTDEHKLHVKDHVSSLETEILALTKELSVSVSDSNAKANQIKLLESFRLKCEASILAERDKKTKVDLLDVKITGLEDQFKQYDVMKTQLANNVVYLDNIITETESKIVASKSTQEKHSNHLDLLNAVKFVIGEEGVKSYIVKKIIQNINSSMAKYLKKLDSNSICIFNEYFEEEILNEKGKICLYNNFSGAERKAIDLACLFAFMDIRKSQGDVTYNLSFYDELFDSSLDEKGVQHALDILNERAALNNECIFIISHRKESSKMVSGDTIFLEKENGLTRRVYDLDN